MDRSYHSFYLLFIAFVVTGIVSCIKLVDPGTPPNRITSAQVYANDSMAMAAVNGIYTQMMQVVGLLNGSATYLCGEYADELKVTTPNDKDDPFVSCTLTAKDDQIRQIWIAVYKYIYSCNQAIEGLENSSATTESLRNQLSGEAYFLRALNYFYMVNLFGDVPLVTGTDYSINAKMGRTPVSEVYEQMISDLQEAQNRLSPSYFTTDEYPTQRIRANKLAATALLARLYLYTKNWVAAEAAATQVIESPLYRLETNLQQIFLSSSNEAILQFMPISKPNAAEGSLFIPSAGNVPSYVLTNSLLGAFEAADKRRQWINKATVNGITYHSPFKYQLPTGPPYAFNTVLRLAEQFLIRTEARVMQNNLTGAADDLNMLRTRAGLALTGPFTSQAAAMTALENERRVELFAEWGHRWFDLTRWPARNSSDPNKTRADEVMGSCKQTWKASARLWPIPADQLNLNASLQQNNGY